MKTFCFCYVQKWISMPKDRASDLVQQPSNVRITSDKDFIK